MFKALAVCLIFLFSVTPLSAQEQEKLKPETKAILERIEKTRISNLITPEDREAMVFLIEAGADEEFLGILDAGEIVAIADSFRKRKLSRKFAKQLSHQPYLELLATLSKIKPDSTPKLKNEIRRIINKRKHSFRLESDYDESFSAFDSQVTDRTVIQLVSYIANYYENSRNVCDLLSLFPNGRASHEMGGIFVLKNNYSSPNQPIKTTFIPLPPKSDDSSPDRYAPITAQRYLPIIGTVHTHPVGFGSVSKFSGPSGSRSVLPDPYPRYGGGDGYALPKSNDFLSLYQTNEMNPFQVETVITLVSRKSFNIDVYFKDVIINSDGTYSNVRAGTVLDLGIYTCR